jgi:hypothetical protein
MAPDIGNAHPTRRRITRILTVAPILCSLLATAIVLGNVAAGVPPQPDEGAAAHLFQLLIAVQLRLVLLFLATADWARPGWPLLALAVQALAGAAALGALYWGGTSGGDEQPLRPAGLLPSRQRMARARPIGRGWLALAAIGIGIAVVALEDILFGLLTGRRIGFAMDVEPVNAFIAAIPFLILAALGARTLLPWLAGLALTLAAWAYVLIEGVSYQWHPDGSGADIGLGIAMIFLVPPLISAACIGAWAWQRRRRPPGR